MKLILTNQYSELLLLVNGLALLLFYAAKQKKRQRAMKFGNYETLQKVAGDSFLSASRAMLVIKMLALTILILGISNPVLQREAPATNSDYVIALDTSSSMLTSDLDNSRLSAAKSVSDDFIVGLSNSTQIGAVSFSGQINNQTELTAEQENVRAFISKVGVGEYAGTAIGEAIYTSTTMLSGSDNNKTIILITDGINNRGRSLNDSIAYAESNKVKINAIGIGSENSSTENPNNESRIDYPNLDSEGLMKISSETGGNYTTVTSESELREALLNIETSTVEMDFSNHLILLALVLFLGEWALGTTRYDILP